MTNVVNIGGGVTTAQKAPPSLKAVLNAAEIDGRLYDALAVFLPLMGYQVSGNNRANDGMERTVFQNIADVLDWGEGADKRETEWWPYSRKLYEGTIRLGEKLERLENPSAGFTEEQRFFELAPLFKELWGLGGECRDFVIDWFFGIPRLAITFHLGESSDSDYNPLMGLPYLKFLEKGGVPSDNREEEEDEKGDYF